MPRLLHNHNGLLARPNCRHLRRLFDRSVPTDRWQGQINRRLQFPAEVGEAYGVCFIGIQLGGGVGKGGGMEEGVVELLGYTNKFFD